MKSIFISQLSRKITQHKEKIQVNLKLYNQLKVLPGIKYIEEITGEALELSMDYMGNSEIRIFKELHPDIMCSVAGEIEAECAFNCDIVQDIYLKRLIYEFAEIDIFEIKLSIILGDPICEWIIEKEDTKYYKSTDVKSTTKKGRMICD